MYTSLLNSEPIPEFILVRVIVETLKLSENKSTIDLNEISGGAGTSTIFAKRILEESISISNAALAIVDSLARFKLAIRAARLGALLQVTRALTWQEFEAFSEECLRASGFDTQKGVVVKDESRRWQIDVIARKGPMVLAVDCKHWESPGYHSKIKKAAEHQKQAVRAYMKLLVAGAELAGEGVVALPVILTLFEPRSRLSEGAVVVSVEQFADFLEGASPYASLPFIHAREAAKSSIS